MITLDTDNYPFTFQKNTGYQDHDQMKIMLHIFRDLYSVVNCPTVFKSQITEIYDIT